MIRARSGAFEQPWRNCTLLATWNTASDAVSFRSPWHGSLRNADLEIPRTLHPYKILEPLPRAPPRDRIGGGRVGACPARIGQFPSASVPTP